MAAERTLCEAKQRPYAQHVEHEKGTGSKRQFHRNRKSIVNEIDCGEDYPLTGEMAIYCHFTDFPVFRRGNDHSHYLPAQMASREDDGEAVCSLGVVQALSCDYGNPFFTTGGTDSAVEPGDGAPDWQGLASSDEAESRESF